MIIKPRKIFLTKGIGIHREKLASFEEALRDAGIAPYNLVKVSSIFPPKAELVSKEEGLRELEQGQILFCVLSDNATNEEHRLISASVGLALPSDDDKYGYISEHHSFGENQETAGDYAEDLAAEMLATTLGISIDDNLHYDERKELWRMQKQIVKTTNITQTTYGKETGKWTTVVAAAVMIT